MQDSTLEARLLDIYWEEKNMLRNRNHNGVELKLQTVIFSILVANVCFLCKSLTSALAFFKKLSLP